MGVTFGLLMQRVRAEQGLTLIDFVKGLSEFVPEDEQYRSKQIGSFWQRDKYLPRLTWLDYIARYAPVGTWQQTFAAGAVEIVKGEYGSGND